MNNPKIKRLEPTSYREHSSGNRGMQLSGRSLAYSTRTADGSRGEERQARLIVLGLSAGLTGRGV